MNGMSKGYKDLAFSMLTAGLPLIETKINDTLKVATNPSVVIFSALLGFSIGVVASLMLYSVDKIWYLPLIYFTFAPPLINIVANYVALFYIYLMKFIYRMYYSRDMMVVSSSFFSIFVACLIFWLPYLHLREVFNPGTEFGYVFMLIVPTLYAAISEVVHYVIYRYIIHRFNQDEISALAAMDPALSLRSPSTNAQASSLEKAPGGKVVIGMQAFNADDLIMLEAQGNYLRIVTVAGEFTERCQMSGASESLDDNLGLQIHRSYWVSYSAIAAFVRVDGNLHLKLTNGEEVKIARPRQREVRSILEARGIELCSSSAPDLGDA